MTEREYRQDDRTEGYCPRCGEPLSAMTTGGRGYCETHGWQYAEWKMNYVYPDRDPGDETDEREAQP